MTLADIIIETIDRLTDEELVQTIAEVGLDLITSAGERSCVANAQR